MVSCSELEVNCHYGDLLISQNLLCCFVAEKCSGGSIGLFRTSAGMRGYKNTMKAMFALCSCRKYY